MTARNTIGGFVALLVLAAILAPNKDTPETATAAVAAAPAPVPTAAELAAAKAEAAAIEAENREQGCLKLQAATDARHEPKKCTSAAIIKSFRIKDDGSESVGLCFAAAVMTYNGNNKRNTIKKVPADVRQEIGTYCIMTTMGVREDDAASLAKVILVSP